MHRLAAVAFLSCILGMACKESYSAEECSPGHEGCVCTEDDTCLPGLVCTSNLCVSDGSGSEEESSAQGASSEEGGDSSGDSSTDASTDTDTEATTEGGDGDGGTPACGNGTVDDGEVCDDGNTITEFPVQAGGTYAPGDCMSDCSMVLADCGNGVVDPGEACDDGNEDSTDECTTSCNVNDMGVHAACSRSTPNEDPDQGSGTITNCTPQQEGFAVTCGLSYDFDVVQFYAAEGECGLSVLECTANCLLVPPDLGDWDTATECPDGHFLLQEVKSGGVLDPSIRRKACAKTCESDSECRWNARDEYWALNGGPAYGQNRCSVHPLSSGQKICWDSRND